MKYATEHDMKKDWPTMKNHLIQVIKMAIIFYICIFAIVGLLSSCNPTKEITQFKSHSISYHTETLNTLEDMREWLLWDIEEGRMDSTATWYLTNLDACIADLRGQTP